MWINESSNVRGRAGQEHKCVLLPKRASTVILKVSSRVMFWSSSCVPVDCVDGESIASIMPSLVREKSVHLPSSFEWWILIWALSVMSQGLWYCYEKYNWTSLIPNQTDKLRAVYDSVVETWFIDSLWDVAQLELKFVKRYGPEKLHILAQASFYFNKIHEKTTQFWLVKINADVIQCRRGLKHFYLGKLLVCFNSSNVYCLWIF